jgi:hypothetical protein
MHKLYANSIPFYIRDGASLDIVMMDVSMSIPL